MIKAIFRRNNAVFYFVIVNHVLEIFIFYRKYIKRRANGHIYECLLADRLLPAFDSSSGIPFNGVILSTGQPSTHGEASSTAEATTIQLEFKYLSYLTGDMKYWKAAEKVMDRMHELTKDNDHQALDGLVPIYIE